MVRFGLSPAQISRLLKRQTLQGGFRAGAGFTLSGESCTDVHARHWNTFGWTGSPPSRTLSVTGFCSVNRLANATEASAMTYASTGHGPSLLNGRELKLEHQLARPWESRMLAWQVRSYRASGDAHSAEPQGDGAGVVTVDPFSKHASHVGSGDGGRSGGLAVRGPPEDLPYVIKGLNHIAIAVPDLAAAAEHYRTVFGAHVSEPLDQHAHGVTVIFVRLGNFNIELLHPLGEASPIAGFLQKNPRGGLHHLCLTVDDLEAAVSHVKEQGVATLGEHPKLGAHHNPVMFLNPKSNCGVLCELEEVRSHYAAAKEE